MRRTNVKLPRVARIHASFLISDIGRLQRLSLDGKMAALGLNRSEWWLIAFLIYAEGSTQQQLADVMESGRSGIAKLIDRLEKKKLIRRAANAHDGRLKHVYLSEQAKPLAESVKQALAETARESMRKLSSAQIEAFNSTLSIIEETLLEDMALRAPDKSS